MTAITAVTVQNTKGVSGVRGDLTARRSPSRSAPWRATSGSTRRRPGCWRRPRSSRRWPRRPRRRGSRDLVVDPVFVSKHGHPLLAEDAVDALRRADPAARDARDPQPARGGRPGGLRGARRATTCGGRLTRSWPLGPRAVLVKGGHLEGDRAADLFVDGDGRGVARRRADRHAAHARDRVHAVGGDHGASRSGCRAAGRRPRREGVRDGGDPSRAPARRRDRPGRSGVVDRPPGPLRAGG